MKKISEVEAVEIPGFEPIPRIQELKDLVEEPLLLACTKLHEKNVLTGMSSANRKDVGSYAYISILLSNLSPENQEILNHIADKVSIIGATSEQLRYPINETTTVLEVSDYFCMIADQFVMQDIQYGVYDLEQMRSLYEAVIGCPCSNDLSCEDIADMLEFVVYDEKAYETEEALNRHLNYATLVLR